MMKLRVVKVGGSLLQRADVADRLARWLIKNADMQNVLIAGGGHVADLVRENKEKLSDQQCHDLAIKAMSFNAHLVSQIISNRPPCESLDDLAPSHAQNLVFDSADWILKQPNVPASWDFSSDSIAARLASTLNANELVLLKSRNGAIDEPGFVDPCFAAESKSIASVRVGTLDE